MPSLLLFSFFFFTAPATTEIYTLSLHDALPISRGRPSDSPSRSRFRARGRRAAARATACSKSGPRSEEHTSELQSRRDLVCRLLLEKKKKKKKKKLQTDKTHNIKKRDRAQQT